MKDNLTFREITEQDIKQLNEIRNAKGVNQYIVSEDIETEETTKKYFLPNRERKYTIIAQHEDKVVAYITFVTYESTRSSHVAKLSISVDEEYHGKGFGAQTIEYGMQYAKTELGIRKLNLAVMVDNTGAINLYKKLGFQQEGYMNKEVFVHGEFVDVILMAKFL